MSYQKKQGFTLIELLVVVLIIGILAAVALAQYQKAVKKARYTEYALFLHAYEQAIDRYLLEHGYQDVDFAEHPQYLDVSFSDVSKDGLYFKTAYMDAWCNTDPEKCYAEIDTSSFMEENSYLISTEKTPQSNHWVHTCLGDTDICDWWINN